MSLATNAALYRAVAKLLTSWGWPVEYAAGWETRTNGSAIRTPSAVTVHHTGGKATATSYLLNPRDRPQLKVLANMHVTADHRIKILAAGSTSHGGYTHEACYQRVVQGTAPLNRDLVPGADSKTFSINTRTVGIEVDGAGGKSEWDAWTIRAVVAISAAWQIVTGWMADSKAARVGAHKEHTLRKPGDPWMSMGELRTRVAEVVASGKPYGPTEAPVIPPVITEPDGAADPEPTPDPEVPTVPTDPAELSAIELFGSANCQSYDGSKTEAAWRSRARIMASKGWSVVSLQESTAAGRKVMCDELKKLTGHVWKAQDLDGKTVAVIWDDTVWSARKPRGKRFGSPPTAFGHGVLIQPLLHRLTRIGVDIGSVHVRPKSIATVAKKEADVAVVRGQTKGWPWAIAGDWCLDHPAGPGIRATPVVDTVKSDGGANSRVDATFIGGKIGAGKATKVDPGPLSDHYWWGLELVLGGGSTL